MNATTHDWLRGQIDAIMRLTDSVAKTVAAHDVDAAKELGEIKYTCNRAVFSLNKAVAEAGGRKQWARLKLSGPNRPGIRFPAVQK